jgi:hypothetical protein
MRHFTFALTFLFALIIFCTCSQKEIKYIANFDFSSNIKNEDDIKLMIKQRLVLKDSIDYKILIDSNKCTVEFYSDIDTSLISRFLINQLEDGFYNVYKIKELYEMFLEINNVLAVPLKQAAINELKNKEKKHETLLDEITIIKDSIKLAEIEERGFYPLFEMLIPAVNQIGELLDIKPIGFIKIDDLDKLSQILSSSSFLPSNTIFMVSCLDRKGDIRDFYAINKSTWFPPEESHRDSSGNVVRVFNNKVEETSKNLRKSIEGAYGSNIDLSSSKEIKRYVPLMCNNMYLTIRQIKITTR